MSDHGASQFAVKPRFAGPRNPIARYSTARSPKARKDRVEEFDEDSVTSENENRYEPLLGSVKRLRGGERIDETFNDFEENGSASNAIHSMEGQPLIPSTRKRKIPLPPSWYTTDATDIERNNHRTLPLKHALDTETPPTRSKQDTSFAISPLPPTSANENQFLVSPRFSSSISPSSAGRSVPRFDFTKLTERTASKLQKVTGTGQFIFDSTSSARDGHNEALNLENANLTLLFSPQKHRKYQYAPGGLAATVRDWVLDAAAGINSTTTLTTFRVLTVETGQRGSRMVYGLNKLQERERYLLLGEPRGSRVTAITIGSHITIMDPSWKLELEEVWTVAVNWKVYEADNI